MKFILAFFIFLNLSCSNSNIGFLASELVDEASSEDRRRRATVRRTRNENQCEDFDRCVNICDQLLDYSEDEEDCYELSLEDIGKMEDIFIQLKEEDFLNNLGSTNSSKFDLFIEYGARSWINIIEGDYRSSNRDDDYGKRNAYMDEEKLTVALWILGTSWVFRSVEESSYGDLVIKTLLLWDEEPNPPLNSEELRDLIIIGGQLDSDDYNDYKKAILLAIVRIEFDFPQPSSSTVRADQLIVADLLDQNYRNYSNDEKSDVLTWVDGLVDGSPFTLNTLIISPSNYEEIGGDL